MSIETVQTAEVTAAVAELTDALPGRVSTHPDPAGLLVEVTGVTLSDRWTPRTGTLWFLSPYHYPDAAIYPYYITDATPTGGIINGLQPVPWRDGHATQVSLRHHRWNPMLDTALGCVLQAQAWLNSH
jgi:hypothetical protein